MARLLPLRPGDARFQRGKAEPDGARGAARLARGVRHVGRDRECEDRLGCRRDGRIGFGLEGNDEPACFIRFSRPMGDLLGASTGIAEPIGPPARILHFAHNPVSHLGTIHRRARVGQRHARDGHGLIQPELLVRNVQLGFEFRPLVFFDPDGAGSAWTLGLNGHGSGQTIGRSRERATQGAKVIAQEVESGDFLAIGVLENDPDGLFSQPPVIVVRAVDTKAESFEINRLSRPVDGAVGEEDGLLVGVDPPGRGRLDARFS